MPETGDSCTLGPEAFKIPAQWTGGNRLHTVAIRREVYERLKMTPDRVFIAQTKPNAESWENIQDGLIASVVNEKLSLEGIPIGNRGIWPGDKVRFKPDDE